MKQLSDPIKIGGLSLKNRLIRSATYEYDGADETGNLTQQMENIWLPLAKGGVAAIITGQMAAGFGGLVGPSMTRTQGPEFVPKMQAILAKLKPYDCRVIVQINNAGAKGIPNTPGGTVASPSGVAFYPDRPAHAMTADEIHSVTEDFARAAAACKAAGADGVQIHAAHGYLLSEFLSPATNQRTDQYGGSIENRARFLLEVYDAMRAAVGKDYPIWIKINGDDLTDPGITTEEFLWVCRQLEARGIDAIEVSGGVGLTPKSSSVQPVPGEEREAYFSAPATALAQVVSVPVITVAGHRQPARILKALEDTGAVAASLCRPFIREPALAARWLQGDDAPATCISCSKCFRPEGNFGCKMDL